MGIFIGAFGDKLLNTKSSLIIPCPYLIEDLLKNFENVISAIDQTLCVRLELATFDCKVLIIHVCGIFILHWYYNNDSVPNPTRISIEIESVTSDMNVSYELNQV